MTWSRFFFKSVLHLLDYIYLNYCPKIILQNMVTLAFGIRIDCPYLFSVSIEHLRRIPLSRYSNHCCRHSLPMIIYFSYILFNFFTFYHSKYLLFDQLLFENLALFVAFIEKLSTSPLNYHSKSESFKTSCTL